MPIVISLPFCLLQCSFLRTNESTAYPTRTLWLYLISIFQFERFLSVPSSLYVSVYRAWCECVLCKVYFRFKRVSCLRWSSQITLWGWRWRTTFVTASLFVCIAQWCIVRSVRHHHHRRNNAGGWMMCIYGCIISLSLPRFPHFLQQGIYIFHSVLNIIGMNGVHRYTIFPSVRLVFFVELLQQLYSHTRKHWCALCTPIFSNDLSTSDDARNPNIPRI